MDQAGNTFRTAVVGGFNRQDVLDYIECSTKESLSRVSSLQKELDKHKKTGDTLEQELAQTKQRAQALDQELETLKKDHEEKAQALSNAQQTLEQQRVELDTLRAELSTLKNKTIHWESGAKAYNELKDRTATIELEAHQRAQVIEKQAQEEAHRVRMEAEQILHKVQVGYGRLRGDLDATITHAEGEIGKVDKALDQVRVEFAEHDATLDKLLSSCRERVFPQPGQSHPEKP